jgi:hypothetical protein
LLLWILNNTRRHTAATAKIYKRVIMLKAFMFNIYTLWVMTWYVYINIGPDLFSQVKPGRGINETKS